jgi:hypothetical protein
MPGTDDPQSRGEYVAKEFGKVTEQLAAASKRANNPRHQSRATLSARREQTLYSLSQLDAEQVAAIEVDYRSGVMPVEELCLKHRIVRSTLYALANKRSWPLRSEIQRAMAEAVQESVVTSLTIDLRRAVNGGTGPVDAGTLAASGKDGDLGAVMPDGHELLAPEDGEPLTERSLNDIAKQDLLVEQYAIAVALVLKSHRAMAKQAVDACRDLVDINQKAIAAAKERALELLHNPKELAAYLDPVAKSLSSSVKTMREAIDLQRQALAIDSTAGKGLALADLARVRAVQAGMAGHAAIQGQPSGPASREESDADDEAMPIPAEVGSYERLVREAEARGVKLA